MKDDRGEAKKSVNVQIDKKVEKGAKTVVVRKSVSMPNPVKGLKLSLYPMTKQH